MEYCNFIKNSHDNKYNGLIFIYSSNKAMNIEYSCIMENKAKYVFQAESTQINIIKCTVDENALSSTIGTINTNDMSVPYSFIVQLKGTENEYCYGNYDSIGSLTQYPIPTLETTTNKMKKLRTITYDYHRKCHFLAF